MGHALIDEFARASTLHPDFLRRCQRVFKTEIQPMLDERESLLLENLALRQELEVWRAQSGTGCGRVSGERPHGDAGGETPQTSPRHRVRHAAKEQGEEGDKAVTR